MISMAGSAAESGWLPVEEGEHSGPESWLFFAVAKVNSSYRPLAVARRPDWHSDEALATFDRELLCACIRILKIFSDPSNAGAIRAELSLAAEFYADDVNRPPRRTLTALGRGAQQPGRRDSERRMHWDRSPREFPFISTCLVLGASYSGPNYEGRTEQFMTEPLGTVFRDENQLEFGVVVVDITEPARVRYGIIAFATQAELHWGAIEYGQTLEIERPRRVMSAAEYMRKFEYEWAKEIDALENVPLMDNAALAEIWPNDKGKRPDRLLQPPRVADHPSLHDQVIKRLIDSTMETHVLTSSQCDRLRILPGFQACLRHHLKESAERIGDSPAAGQLLALAFEDEAHLGFTHVKRFSTESLGAAISAPELKNATSLTLRIDACSFPACELVNILSRHPKLRELYLLDNPLRKDDSKSIEAFLHLSAGSAELLSRCRLMISGAYSAPLRQNLWLPTSDFHFPQNLYPVAQVFIRVVQDRFLRYPDKPPTYRYKYHHLGDALLGPARFAAGFPAFLRRLAAPPFHDEEKLFAFASAPPSLADMARAEVSPIPAESFAIPRRPGLPNRTDGTGGLDYDAECWPKPRDLVRGSWTALVAQDYRVDAAGAAAQSNRRRSRVCVRRATRFLRYALVTPRRERVTLSAGGGTAAAASAVGPDGIEVCDLVDFLRRTGAGEAEASLVPDRMADLASYMERLPQAPLPADMQRVGVMDPEEAAAVLQDCLAGAAAVRKNLRRLMMAKPDGECYV